MRLLPDGALDMHRSILDLGWIPLLYFAATKCRVPRLRREALSLLGRTSHREGIWDARIASLVARRVVEVEEGGVCLCRPSQGTGSETGRGDQGREEGCGDGPRVVCLESSLTGSDGCEGQEVEGNSRASSSRGVEGSGRGSLEELAPLLPAELRIQGVEMVLIGDPTDRILVRGGIKGLEGRRVVGEYNVDRGSWVDLGSRTFPIVVQDRKENDLAVVDSENSPRNNNTW